MRTRVVTVRRRGNDCLAITTCLFSSLPVVLALLPAAVIVDTAAPAPRRTGVDGHLSKAAPHPAKRIALLPRGREVLPGRTRAGPVPKRAQSERTGSAE